MINGYIGNHKNNIYKIRSNIKSTKQNIVRAISTTSLASEVEFFVIIVYSFIPLTIFIKNSF